MKITEIITENQGDIYFDEWGKVYFRTPEALARAENSDWDKLRLAAKDFRNRDPQVGKNFATDWNALPQGDQHNTQLTTTKPPQEKPQYIVRRDANKVSTADRSKPMQEPMQVALPKPVELDVALPKPTMPMGGIAGVIRRKKQK
jgi:hypothetical protein